MPHGAFASVMFQQRVFLAVGVADSDFPEEHHQVSH